VYKQQQEQEQQEQQDAENPFLDPPFSRIIFFFSKKSFLSGRAYPLLLQVHFSITPINVSVFAYRFFPRLPPVTPFCQSARNQFSRRQRQL
jgi:hypothetical protein